MFLNYEPEKIRDLIRDFFVATGVVLGVCDENFKLLTYERQKNNKFCELMHTKNDGRLACRCSDRELLERCKAENRAVMHVCHAGLVDLALPIMYEKKIIAYLLLGQIRTEKSFPVLEKKALFSNEEISELQVFYDELSIFDQAKIESISNVAMMMVKYILFEKMLTPKYDPAFERALAFINENYERNLTISEISRSSFVPKSSLYKMFHSHLGCTVSEYINSRKIDKATSLLLNSELSIEEISERLGFSTQQYFSKIFKKNKGISPAKFRKSNH